MDNKVQNSDKVKLYVIAGTVVTIGMLVLRGICGIINIAVETMLNQ